MKSKNIKFKSSQGHMLSARMDLPDSGECRTAVLFAHCFTCSKNLNAVGHISRALTDRGEKWRVDTLKAEQNKHIFT
ncbi:MAG: hypothetical protein EA364_11850, partial [Balneolaceae bacterium]